MKIFIYVIYFPTSDRLNPYYIGQTAYLKRRMSEHLVNKSLVGNALRKYDDWQIEILHTCKTQDEANRTEIEEIRHYNCVAPNGYNLTRGGEGGDTFTNNLNKERIRKAHQCKKPGTSAAMKCQQYFKGHHHTEKTKDILREASTGNKNARGHTFKPSKEWKKSKSKAMQGNRNAALPIDVKVKRLKTKIAKLKGELGQ